MDLKPVRYCGFWNENIFLTLKIIVVESLILLNTTVSTDIEIVHVEQRKDSFSMYKFCIFYIHNTYYKYLHISKSHVLYIMKYHEYVYNIDFMDV